MSQIRPVFAAVIAGQNVIQELQIVVVNERQVLLVDGGVRRNGLGAGLGLGGNEAFSLGGMRLPAVRLIVTHKAVVRVTWSILKRKRAIESVPKKHQLRNDAKSIFVKKSRKKITLNKR